MKKPSLFTTTSAIIAEVNPFLIIDESGKPMKYSNAMQAYCRLFMLLHKQFTRGFIDIPYFMVKYMGMELTEAEKVCGAKQYATILWECHGQANEYRNKVSTLKTICEILLSVSSLEFDENAFHGGMSMFEEALVLQKLQ